MRFNLHSLNFDGII